MKSWTIRVVNMIIFECLEACRATSDDRIIKNLMVVLGLTAL